MEKTTLIYDRVCSLLCQLNKDYAYWIEKRRLGQPKGGQVAGLLSDIQEGVVKQNIQYWTKPLEDLKAEN